MQGYLEVVTSDIERLSGRPPKSLRGVLIVDLANTGVNDASCVDNLLVGAQLVANRDGAISEVTPGLIRSAGVVAR